MVYISLLEEYDSYSPKLSSMKGTDTLVLVYEEGRDKITLSSASKIFSAKCKVEYVPYIDREGVSKDIAYGFTIGTLNERYKGIKSLSNNKVINALLGNVNKTSEKKTVGRKKSTAVEEPKTEQTVDKPVRTRKPRTPKATTPSSEEKPFEYKVPLDLKHLLAKCDNTQVELTDYAIEIYNACKKSILNKRNLKECIMEEIPNEEKVAIICKSLSVYATELPNAVCSIIKHSGKEM